MRKLKFREAEKLVNSCRPRACQGKDSSWGLSDSKVYALNFCAMWHLSRTVSVPLGGLSLREKRFTLEVFKLEPVHEGNRKEDVGKPE